MITLKTGIIGSGKSLSAVAELAALQDRWRTPAHEAERRPVYVQGIRGLALDHLPLPIYPAKGSPGDPVELDDKGRPLDTIVIDWASVPTGALVIIDECQDAFPPRGSAAKVPEHVAWLQRSRHHAVDVVLITQHPRLIDSTVRAFVGKHEHVRRLFGSGNATIYEWDSCSDGLSYKTATKRLWPYPRKAFKWYTSADEHTKQSFRLPAWIAVPVLGIAFGVYSAPTAWHALHGAATGKGIGQVHAAAASAPVQPVVAPAVLAAASASPVDAPDAPRGGASAPVLGGCVSMGSRCLCVDDKGHAAPMEPAACHRAAREYGDAIPYPSTPAPDAPRGAVVASLSASAAR